MVANWGAVTSAHGAVSEDGAKLGSQNLERNGETVATLVGTVGASTCGAGPSAKSCAELGWPYRWGNAEVCGESDRGDWACTSSVPFAAAEAVCADLGARLCTALELAANVARGTGCQFDRRFVWAGDASCPPGEALLAPGRSSDSDPACVPADSPGM